MRTRLDTGFWARLASTTVFANAPLAWAAVSGGLHMGVALGLSAVAGVFVLVLWEGVRSSPQEARV